MRLQEQDRINNVLVKELSQNVLTHQDIVRIEAQNSILIPDNDQTDVVMTECEIYSLVYYVLTDSRGFERGDTMDYLLRKMSSIGCSVPASFKQVQTYTKKRSFIASAFKNGNCGCNV